jgi:hypothetical protein
VKGVSLSGREQMPVRQTANRCMTEWKAGRIAENGGWWYPGALQIEGVEKSEKGAARGMRQGGNSGDRRDLNRGLLSPSCCRRLKWGAYEILKIGQQSSASHQPPCRQSEADDWTPKGLPIRQPASMQPPYSAQPGKARQVPGNFRASCAA